MTNHPPLSPSELAHLALRYAANDLAAPDMQAFEVRLCDDQEAREALAEAIRLSAAASSTSAVPDASLKPDIIEKVHPTWFSRLLPRRRYRGHPAIWATAGAVVVGTVAVTMWTGSSPNDGSFAQQVVTSPQTQQVMVPTESVVITRREVPEFPNSKLNPMGWHEKHPNTEAAVPMEPLAVGRKTERTVAKPTSKPDVAESDVPVGEVQPMPMSESATKKL
jgi:hypothetical protein